MKILRKGSLVRSEDNQFYEVEGKENSSYGAVYLMRRLTDNQRFRFLQAPANSYFTTEAESQDRL